MNRPIAWTVGLLIGLLVPSVVLAAPASPATQQAAGTQRRGTATSLPCGQDTPEGVACDAVMAYIRCDSKAWLATLVRPMYGPDGDKQYAEFKKQMVAQADQQRGDPAFRPPTIAKCFRARPFSRNGPASAAYAMEEFTGNLFVDIEVQMPNGQAALLRYHVLQDKDKRWYFDPRPDLNPLFALGLNEEPASRDVLYEDAGPRRPGGRSATQPEPKPAP